MNLFRATKKSCQKLTDQELILLLREKDCAHTIPILYERYSHLVFGVCLKYLKSKEDAEDITLSLFSLLDDKLMKHEITHFKSWLYQVTKNDCFQFLRKKKIETTAYDIDLIKELEDSAFEKYDLEIQLDLLERAIPTLKHEQQVCIKLFYLDNYSYNQISEQMQLPINTVKSAIQNGKRNLKIWMENHGK
jgi:RNA polymerase sigma-70 factor (ECF subfamily)